VNAPEEAKASRTVEPPLDARELETRLIGGPFGAGGCLFVVRSTARVGQEEQAEACCGATKKAVAVRFDG
jgi:hypothetical protein